MSFELSFFDDYLNTHFSRASSAAAVFPGYPAQVLLIEAEKEAFRKRIIANLFSLASEQEIELCVRHHQSALTAMADTLSGFLMDDQINGLGDISAEPSRLNICKLLYASFEELLSFLRTYCRRYFDLDASLPEVQRHIASLDLSRNMLPLRQRMEKLGFDPDLVHVACCPVDEFCDRAAGESPSYRQLAWVRELIRELALFLDRPAPAKGYDYGFFKMLCYLNLNTVYFVDHCKQRIHNELREMSNLQDVLIKQKWYLKVVRQFVAKPGFGFRISRPHIKDLVALWLEQEIIYTEAMLAQMSAPQHSDSRVKLKFGMPMAQLAYLVRLMVETKVIVQPPGEVIHFFAEHTSTTLSASFSGEKFRQRFYSPDLAVVTAVRGFVNKMIAFAKTFF